MTRTAPTLALAMIVKNEEDNIRRCLDSVVGLVDEIVIVDTGSTDSTKEIAGTYRDTVPGSLRILDFEWSDDFSKARNHGLEAIESDWILQLDADEELASDSAKLKETIRDKYNWVFYVNIVAAQDLTKLDVSTETTAVPRLFRNRPKIRYRFPVHEHIYAEDNNRYGHSDLTINHFGPAVAPTKASDRSVRNIPLLEKAIAQYPEHPHFKFHLAMEYWNQGKLDEAEPYLRQSIDGVNPQERHVAAAERNLAWILYAKGKVDSAQQLLHDLQSKYPDFTDLFFVEGKILGEIGSIEPALRVFAYCLKMGDPPPNYLSWGGTGSWRARKEGEEVWRKNQ